jgi:hypothetical protein
VVFCTRAMSRRPSVWSVLPRKGRLFQARFMALVPGPCGPVSLPCPKSRSRRPGPQRPPARHGRPARSAGTGLGRYPRAVLPGVPDAGYTAWRASARREVASSAAVRRGWSNVPARDNPRWDAAGCVCNLGPLQGGECPLRAEALLDHASGRLHSHVLAFYQGTLAQIAQDRSGHDRAARRAGPAWGGPPRPGACQGPSWAFVQIRASRASRRRNRKRTGPFIENHRGRLW